MGWRKVERSVEGGAGAFLRPFAVLCVTGFARPCHKNRNMTVFPEYPQMSLRNPQRRRVVQNNGKGMAWLPQRHRTGTAVALLMEAWWQ